MYFLKESDNAKSINTLTGSSVVVGPCPSMKDENVVESVSTFKQAGGGHADNINV